MSRSVTVRAIDVTVRLTILGEDPAALERAVRSAWSRCLALDSQADSVVSLTAGVGLDEGDDVVTGDSPALVMERLTQRVTLAGVQAGAGELLMLHAAALAHPRTGQTAVMAASSGTGKTTLAADLGDRWCYVTDETAAISADDALVPYPKPLSVVTPGHPKRQCSPDDLGLRPLEGAARPRLLLLLERRASLAEAELELLPLPEALALLAEHTSYLDTLDRPLHRMGDLILACGGLRRVTYAGTEQLHEVLAEALGDPT